MAKNTALKTSPLDSWHALQEHIHGMSENDLTNHIARELDGKCRRNMVMRMFMKLNKLRYRREREELEKKIKAKSKN